MPATRDWSDLIQVQYDFQSGLYDVRICLLGLWHVVSSETEIEDAEAIAALLISWKEQ